MSSNKFQLGLVSMRKSSLWMDGSGGRLSEKASLVWVGGQRCWRLVADEVEQIGRYPISLWRERKKKTKIDDHESILTGNIGARSVSGDIRQAL